MTPNLVAFSPLILPLFGMLMMLILDRLEFVLPSLQRRPIARAAATDIIGLACTGVTLLALYPIIQQALRGPFESTLIGWIPRDSFEVSLTIRVDGLAIFIVSITCFTAFGLLLATAHGLAAVINSVLPRRIEGMLRLPAPLPARQHAAVLALLAAISGVALFANLLLIYICWESITLLSYLLLVERRSDDPSIARILFLATHLTGFGLLACVMLLGASSDGTLLYTAIRPVFLSRLPLSLIAVAAIGKSGLYPLITWPLRLVEPRMREAFQGASLFASALFHSISMAAGIFLLLRIRSILGPSMPAEISILLQVTAALTISGVTVLAWHKQDLRGLLAYHTLLIAGYALLGLGLGSPLANIAALILIGSHMPVKAIAMICTGHLPHQLGAGEERPWTAFLLVLALASLSGLPLSITLVGLWLLIVIAVQEGAWLMAGIVAITWLIWIFKLLYPAKDFYTPPLTREAVGVYAERRNIPWLIGISLLGLSGIVVSGYAQIVLVALVPLAALVVMPDVIIVRPSALGGLVDLSIMIWLPFTFLIFVIVLLVPPRLAVWLQYMRSFTPVSIPPVLRRRRGRIQRITDRADEQRVTLEELELEHANTEFGEQPDLTRSTNSVTQEAEGNIARVLRWLLEPTWVFSALWRTTCAVSALAVRISDAVETRYFIATTIMFLLVIVYLTLA